MKLLIILSVVASSYADKLDRTYLPPANAATAGGAPGSLTAPGTEPARSSGPSFSQTVEQFARPSGPQSGRSYDASKPGIDSTSSQYQTGAPGPQFGQSGGSGLGVESNAFGQGPAYSGNQGSQEASAYSGQYQPERSNSADGNAEILRYDSQNDGDNFSYSFETSNGITAEESGVATNGVQAQGGYSYTGDDGQQYRVTYTADENGYQPQGDHLPTPHPIPEEILRSIEENARAAASGNQEGAYQPEEDSGLTPQQYNGASSYNGQYQASGQSPSSYNQPGQSPASQFSGINTSPSSASSGSQGYQYSAGSSRELAQNEPTGSGFIPKGQALLDQGPSPSTPTASSIGFPTSSNSGNIQRQRGFNSPDFSASGRQGQGQSQPGYEYNRPQTSSQYGNTNQPEQYRPRPESQQSSNQFGSQVQGPVYTKPQGIGSQSGPTSVSGPNNQGFPKQGFGSTQGPSAPGYSPSVGPAPGTNSGPASSGQDFSYSRPNSPQGYSPTGPSSSPSASQSSAFPRTSSSNEGYVYGPGTGPSGTIAGKSLGTPSGQGFGISGSSGNKNTVPESSYPGQVGQTPASNFGAGLAPQGSGLAGYSKPNGPSAGPRGFANANGPFGDSSQYQANQPSTQLPQGSVFPRPNSSAQPSQGSGFDRPSGSDANSDKGSFGASPQYQPRQTSPSQNSAFPSLNGPNASKSPNNQGLFGSGINQPSGQKSSMLQSAPYQYNRPGFQDSQNQPGSQGPQTQDQSGSQPGFRTPTGRSETFGGPRQRPSFNQEEGYKY